MTSDLPSRLDIVADRLASPGPAPVGAIHARARTRRRHRWLGAGAAAALVALLTTGATFLSPATHPTTTDPVSTVPVVPPVLRGVPCDRSSITTVPFPAGGVLPRGAVTARLCPLYNTWQAPRDELTTGLDDLVDRINAEPTVTNHSLWCPGRDRTEYTIAFSYPDGSTRAVVGEVGGCSDGLHTGPLDGPSPTKLGAQELLTEYVDALAAQRKPQTPPVLDHAPSGACSREEGAAPDSILLPRAELDLSSASVCTYRRTRVKNGFVFLLQKSKPLSAEQVHHLDEEFAQHATIVSPASIDYDVNGLFRTIAGVTPWGDTVTLELDSDGLVRNRSVADPTQDALWPMTARQFTALVGD